ncbi:MAG: FkbM family methyltransferase [Thermodesulfovibrionales bacterium]
MIHQLLKQAAKRTFLYELIQNRRLSRPLTQWTEQDQKMLNFYRQFIKPNDICFDIGANLGSRTKVFLKLDAVVVAVEPQDICMKVLKKFFGKNKSVTLIQKALGEKEGSAEMLVSEAHTLSSLSEQWVTAVRQSGRFASFSWNKVQSVEMTKLDNLIQTYGIPSFIKIDVEGYEYPVLKGLSKPVQTISIEFANEYIESTIKCIIYLSSLGNITGNYSLSESMILALQDWRDSGELIDILKEQARNSPLGSGDVYIKFEK